MFQLFRQPQPFWQLNSAYFPAALIVLPPASDEISTSDTFEIDTLGLLYQDRAVFQFGVFGKGFWKRGVMCFDNVIFDESDTGKPEVGYFIQ